jgi:hypothetical protein
MHDNLAKLFFFLFMALEEVLLNQQRLSITVKVSEGKSSRNRLITSRKKLGMIKAQATVIKRYEVN